MMMKMPMPKRVKMIIKAKGGYISICQIIPMTFQNKTYFNKYLSHFITVQINLHSTVFLQYPVPTFTIAHTCPGLRFQ